MENGKIYIASDHAGFARKHELMQSLRAQGHTVTDLGPQELDPEDDYPEYAFAVAERVADDPLARGILLCGSGVGMCIAANKVPRIRAALAWSAEVAASARADDDANVLCLSARYLDAQTITIIVSRWLETDFSGEERHTRRIEQIAAYER